MIASWIGPAIIAAIISALVTGMGWLVSERQALRREALRRRERRTDMQIALLAEIRASQHRIGGVRPPEADDPLVVLDDQAYTPFIPRQIRPFVFENLVSDIHILPAEAIDPIVVYYQQVSAVSFLAEDMNTKLYSDLSQDRKRMVYRDYTALLRHQGRSGAGRRGRPVQVTQYPGRGRVGPKIGRGAGRGCGTELMTPSPKRYGRADAGYHI